MCLFKAPSCLLLSPQYSLAGCLLSLHHSEKPDHEEVCEFRPYTCPCPGATCKWHGSLEAVMPHLMHAHKSITTLQVRITTLTLHHSDICCKKSVFFSWTWVTVATNLIRSTVKQQNKIKKYKFQCSQSAEPPMAVIKYQLYNQIVKKKKKIIIRMWKKKPQLYHHCLPHEFSCWPGLLHWNKAWGTGVTASPSLTENEM